ncbi:hypothetical protein E2562_032458 [Oryza meyeriana var. granulata]|uniref:Uncharacterized protein n=1 Tax=Oryza meyeriana var. granulata TaxID=110450 RepID=A0A6G1FF03_9ORYZ|nr:hypothetical protein E2562_032458 [Oryza meyeriana var. granulata]
MTPCRDQKLKMVITDQGYGGAQCVADMEALPRETFSPRMRGRGGAAVAPATVGRSNLGVVDF